LFLKEQNDIIKSQIRLILLDLNDKSYQRPPIFYCFLKNLEEVDSELYEIIIFQGDIDDGFSQLEQFEAVLSCPFTYSDRMYHGNYFGVVAKKTSTSSEVVESLLEKIGDLVYGGSDERNLEQNSFKANT
jgi:hypothetical protein